MSLCVGVGCRTKSLEFFYIFSCVGCSKKCLSGVSFLDTCLFLKHKVRFYSVVVQKSGISFDVLSSLFS